MVNKTKWSYRIHTKDDRIKYANTEMIAGFLGRIN
jgi:hypothetical protein